ncbi:MAG: LemA family protein [Patescibacteria group bacterium]
MEGTENRVAVERGRFNEMTLAYNTSVQILPGKFIAPMFGFSPKAYFEAATGSEVAPKVNL